MEKAINLQLYGKISHAAKQDDLAWNLYQTKTLARLRDISLSSTPSSFSPYSKAASRFEHSVGVAYLARTLCDMHPDCLGDLRNTLIAAALCHDTGSPPFSHIAEAFSYDLLGMTHEQAAASHLFDDAELIQLLEDSQVSPQDVISIISGTFGPVGSLIAGSIDLDNIDNSLHLLLSLGYQGERPYEPLDLLRAFIIRESRVALDAAFEPQLAGWALARRELYSILHADPLLSASSMLYRAIEFAYSAELLDEKFFRLDESEALYVLKNRCGRPTKHLLGRLNTWRHYPLIANMTNRIEDPQVTSLYEDWRLRKDFTDELSARLGITARDLALYVGRDKGEKNITLPFLNDPFDAASLFTGNTGHQRIAVFVSPDARTVPGADVHHQLSDLISELPKASGTAHSFF